MWEFCLSTSKINVANFVYRTLRAQNEKNIVTCYEQFGEIFVLVACDSSEKERLCLDIEKCVLRAICSFYKEEYLDQNLHLPVHEKISQMAFKKALINFDKETDCVVISKNLILKNNLHLDSFYSFKLTALRDKWNELVMLANENCDYLTRDDAFFDLLKFLIDNLEVGEDEITVYQNEDCYNIETKSATSRENLSHLSNEGLVGALIELSPKKINIYCDKTDQTVSFLTKIFDERISVNYCKSLQKM